MGLEIP